LSHVELDVELGGLQQQVHARSNIIKEPDTFVSRVVNRPFRLHHDHPVFGRVTTPSVLQDVARVPFQFNDQIWFALQRS
jgi:hypothetical protein